MQVVIYRPTNGPNKGRVYYAKAVTQLMANQLLNSCNGSSVPTEFTFQSMGRRCFCGSGKKFKRCCYVKYFRTKTKRGKVKREREMNFWTSNNKILHLSAMNGEALCGKSLRGMDLLHEIPDTGRVCKTCQRLEYE